MFGLMSDLPSSQISAIVLRAENLPRLKTPFGKKRRFYVTITDGLTMKKTTAQRSIAQIVQWDEKFGIFDALTSSHIKMALYAQQTIGEDILVGTKEIPCISQIDTAFTLDPGDRDSRNITQPVTVYLAITVPTNPSLSLAAVTNASNIKLTERESVPAAKAFIVPTTENLVDTAQPTDPSALEQCVEHNHSPPSEPATDTHEGAFIPPATNDPVITAQPTASRRLLGHIDENSVQPITIPPEADANANIRASASPTSLEIAQHTTSKSLLSQIDEHFVELSNSITSESDADADASAGTSPGNVYNEADKAMKAISISDTWQNAVDTIKWLMDTLAPVAELHPLAKMAWGLLSKIPEPFLQQFQRDDNIRILLEDIRGGLDFAQEADILRNIDPKSRQAQILQLMLQHVCNCGDFIKKYAEDIKFRKRFLNNIAGKVDEKIYGYRTTLGNLRRDFLDRAAITTEIKTFRILDDVGVISADVRGLSTQLEWVSKHVLDIDLEAKIQEIPYKTAWRSDVERDFLPGTRVAFLDYIDQWVDSPSPNRGLVLFGQAGTGKSSIAHEIARRFQDMNRLSSYFVFLRKEQSRSEDYYLFTTLIHDLSSRYPSFKNALGAAVGNNKSLRTTRDYHTLFEDMLLRPLRDLHIVGPIVVVIDALDESGDAYGENGLHSFLAKSLSRLPPQFRVLITSRREKDIDLTFSTAKSVRIVDMIDPMLAATTGKDIRAYLQEKLPAKVFEKHGNSFERKAEGLFQWAAVACAHIRRPPPGITTNRCIRSLLDPSSIIAGLELLDKLYKDILEGYFKSSEARSLFRSVMGQLFAAFEPLSITSLTSLRLYASDGEPDDEDFSAIVGHLGSLLSNVTSSDSSLPIVPLHTSFRDFLTNAGKSGDFYVDIKTAHRDLADYCLNLMLDQLQFNICKLESSYLANKDVPDMGSRIDKYISSSLSYACRYWDDHLEHLDFNPELFAQLQNLFDDKLLFWLELLSITGDLALASSALSALKRWLASDEHKPTTTKTEFSVSIDDASTFVRYFGMPMAKSAPHIYTSCLPFAPTSSRVFQRYATRFPGILSLLRGQLSDWPVLEMEIPAHNYSVRSIAISPDGQYIVSGSSDYTVCLWSTATGEMVGKPFTKHDDIVRSVAFSPDGQYIISGSCDHRICIWNAKMGEMVGEPLTGHTDSVRSVSFSPDGQHIISGSDDYTMRLWKVATRDMVGRPFTGHTGAVVSTSFSPDGRYIASGSDDHTIRMWNTTGEMVGNSFTGHSGSILSVAFSPVRQHIVSGSDDRTIRIWDAKTGKMLGEPFTAHNGSVNCVQFSPDGQHIVSGSDDTTICIWNVTTGEQVGKPLTGHNSWVRSVAYSPDGQHIISSSEDYTIRMWKATAGETVGTPSTGHNASASCVSFSPDGQHIASSHDYTICMWNAAAGEMVGEPFTGHHGWIRSVSFSANGQHILSSSDDRTVRMWNAATGKMVGKPFTGHVGAVMTVSGSPDGRYIVSGSSLPRLCMWDAMTGEMLEKRFTGHDGWIRSASFSPDGNHIISGSDDSTICMWDATTGELVGKPLTGHNRPVNCVAWSPDGQHIVSASDDCKILLWNAETGEIIGKPLTGHNGWVRSVSFSPDGQFIVSGSDDLTIRVWDSTTGEMVGKPFNGHSGVVRSVSFSPDGQYIASASDDSTIRMWDFSAVMAGELSTRASRPAQSDFPDEQHIAPAFDDSTIPPSGNGMEEVELAKFTDHSVINSEGWICGEAGELFLWIPQLHRLGLYRPSNTWVMGEQATRLDLSKFVHGRNWDRCLDSR